MNEITLTLRVVEIYWGEIAGLGETIEINCQVSNEQLTKLQASLKENDTFFIDLKVKNEI